MKNPEKSIQEILSEADFFADTIHEPVDLDYVSNLIKALLHQLENLPSESELIDIIHSHRDDIPMTGRIKHIAKAISARINQVEVKTYHLEVGRYNEPSTRSNSLD